MPARFLAHLPTQLMYVLAIVVLGLGSHSALSAEQPNLFETLGKLFKPAEPAADETAAGVTRSGATESPSADSPTARNLRPVASSSDERRVALVIGNNAYQNVTKLNNASADARAMAREFRALGFDVIEKIDSDQRGMKAAVREFVGKIANGGVGAFFFAGHGVQEGGNNYLLPIDIGALSDPAALPDEAVELNGEVMSRIGQAGAKFSLLVVDACRDNPFPKKSGRSIGGTRGLTAAANAPEGMVVVYSAGVGQQALDRLGEKDRDPNGLFTREFIREMRKPGMEVAEVVRNVRKRVKDQAASIKHDQTPAIYIQADRFYLIPNAENVTIQAAPVVDPETETWQAADSARSEAGYRAYLDAYPNGRFAAAAKIKFGALPKPVAAAVLAPQDNGNPATVPPASTFSKPDAADDPETAFWSEVKASRSREYYDAYLKQYPKGKFVALAKVELKKVDDKEKAEKAKEDAERRAAQAREEAERKRLAEQEKQERVKVEQNLWDGAKREHTVAGYTSYLNTYPSGSFAVLAKLAKDKAQREESEKSRQEMVAKEQESWDDARAADTSASYGRYLDSYPNGRYVLLAKSGQLKAQREADRRVVLAKECSTEYNNSQTVAALKKFVDNFPNDECGRLDQAKQKISLLEPPNQLAAPTKQKVTLSAEVFFRKDSAELLNTVKERLRELAQKATQIKLEVILAIGHSDPQDGGDPYGMSLKRAEAVKAQFVAYGVEPNRVYVEGKGHSSPLSKGLTDEDRLKNRRVEIEVIGTR